jgi:hypothetical protein
MLQCVVVVVVVAVLRALLLPQLLLEIAPLLAQRALSSLAAAHSQQEKTKGVVVVEMKTSV